MTHHGSRAPASTCLAWSICGGGLMPTFVRLLKGSAMTRAKLVGLRRNLAVAMGNGGEPESLEALQESTDDRPSISDPLVQEHITWAINNASK